MFFKQFYDQKLSQTSYMIACQKTKEAIIIDPKRVLDEYAQVAESEGFTITLATETHIHADFASGLRDTGRRFNAKIMVSDEGDENWKYSNMPEGTEYLKDGDKIKIGSVELEVVHTPGHTPESVSFVLTDRGAGSEEPMGMFTGDFLFVCDIGRPDLLEEAAGMEGATEEGADAMFDSLKKLHAYPGFMQIWPGHGAGSACGKSLGAVPLSTLGYERKNNWVFKYEDKEAFIQELTSDQPEPPSYFSQMKRINRDGLSEFKLKEVEVGSPDVISGQIFDLRNKEDFRKGFRKGSINVPYSSKFLQFAGWYIDYDAPMTVIANPGDGKTLQEDLASIGFDNLQLIVPIEDADRYYDDTYENLSPELLVQNHENKIILDVRSTSEYKSGHLDNSYHIHFGHLDEKDLPFSKDDTIYVHCQSGVRSAIALSVLKARGYENAVNVEKGYIGIKKAIN
ncbi:rhodanese-like domain-containing protein [Salinicoccus hispanicus]|uniref:MBL fold metallo-hydrolase n=1 Tax=Salinicoccus hispanicus TaxID=157225 RepID=A0A6N8U0W9_9STAP|nr:MBL fold metallo-hydrolase [Salinicoccus hispanicus]MXQ51710.1 MBL fold metallo-hydrolase [Salinicoccus hispanicus]